MKITESHPFLSLFFATFDRRKLFWLVLFHTFLWWIFFCFQNKSLKRTINLAFLQRNTTH